MSHLVVEQKGAGQRHMWYGLNYKSIFSDIKLRLGDARATRDIVLKISIKYQRKDSKLQRNNDFFIDKHGDRLKRWNKGFSDMVFIDGNVWSLNELWRTNYNTIPVVDKQFKAV